MTCESSPEKSTVTDVLVKVSGDLVGSEQFYSWLSSVSTPQTRLFILCGGGSAITAKLNEQHIGFQFTEAGREIETEEGSILAQQVLEGQKRFVEEKLQEKGIEATVFIPVVVIDGRICHMNGDLLVEALHPSFDKIYIVTLQQRTKQFTEKFDKIEVVNLENN
ncbi:hypothetical protein A3A49_01685 [Candidatus Curtissbacteria bacterium RIFCSPLOWO2_01_FULL_38_11b]|uniref:Aspartate/glutamate/uridylate kinase domain-containing protein n=1 Tax=Candidatus Curtissbacteria bacterium RIFCSPLOWO2_01_FULL_38_11b TaxID=1797725 RepID=A0A1F5H0P2_9BACT|nr:MAG: hypothetical protein A3A49_01685 [Candidatus Curtissbacteria bacterium RIFCSPLOWO2_01_FULL_38_11b]